MSELSARRQEKIEKAKFLNWLLDFRKKLDILIAYTINAKESEVAENVASLKNKISNYCKNEK